MISWNKYLNNTSRRITTIMKNKLNKITAMVSPHVAFRFGHRTRRSSTHAPLKYSQIRLKTFRDVDEAAFGCFLAFSVFWTFVPTALADFGASSLAVMRVTLFDVAATFSSQINSLLLADCQVYCSAPLVKRQYRLLYSTGSVKLNVEP